MTPNEYQKQLTMLLAELLSSTGFQKRRIGTLCRKVGECEQFFTVGFTRDRGLPGNLYTLTCTLSFQYQNVDRLTSYFMGIEYDKKWPTGSRPFYVLLPDRHAKWKKYCSDERLDDLAIAIADDFCLYALPFYETFDTLDKLEKHFDKHPLPSNTTGDFSVVRSKARAGCIAAVYYINEKYDKLKDFAANTDGLSDEQKRIIMEHSPEQKQ